MSYCEGPSSGLQQGPPGGHSQPRRASWGSPWAVMAPVRHSTYQDGRWQNNRKGKGGMTWTSSRSQAGNGIRRRFLSPHLAHDVRSLSSCPGDITPDKHGNKHRILQGKTVTMAHGHVSPCALSICSRVKNVARKHQFAWLLLNPLRIFLHFCPNSSNNGRRFMEKTSVLHWPPTAQMGIYNKQQVSSWSCEINTFNSGR